MTKRIWILGAADPEMESIETLLMQCGETVVHATWEGKRVQGGNAYVADGLQFPDGPAALRPLNDGSAPHIYLVECHPHAVQRCLQCGEQQDLRPENRGLVLSDNGQAGGLGACGDAHLFVETTEIDHHREGDPGFGRAPMEFLRASSLGQVIAKLAGIAGAYGEESLFRFLHGWGEGQEAYDAKARALAQSLNGPRFVHSVARGWALLVDTRDEGDTGGLLTLHIPHDLVLTAAADHCLGAAYRGKCPGVDPNELMRFRAESRARFQRRPIEAVLAEIEATTAALQEAPAVILDEGFATEDVGGFPAQAGVVIARDMRRETPYPELVEAATRLGVGYLSGPLACPDGRRKIACSGDRQQVAAFLREWAPREGLVDCYGDEARGFAGGYLGCGRGSAMTCELCPSPASPHSYLCSRCRERERDSRHEDNGETACAKLDARQESPWGDAA